MSDKKQPGDRWIDRWLRSDADELLEREGATPRGIAIIDELNKVYRQTGLTARLANAIVAEAQRIHRAHGEAVRILEIGMRDGALLGEVGTSAVANQIPFELHGVEFRPNIAVLAETRLAEHSFPAHVHCDASRELRSFSPGEFDIVYSSFVLHHQSQQELKTLVSASFHVSRDAVLHLDLTRSLWAVVILWVFYTLFGYRASRRDAVLSCRRAYRRDEVTAVLRELNQSGQYRIEPAFPFYWTIRRSFESLKL